MKIYIRLDTKTKTTLDKSSNKNNNLFFAPNNKSFKLKSLKA